MQRAEWIKHIETWKKSGMSQRDYCEGEGIRLSSFSNWRTRLLKEGKEPEGRFVQLGRDEPFELVTSSGFTIRIPSSFSETQLKRLIQAVG